MIEMLGVLAIIGVMTIGGFWGYRVAMDKYAAGKIIHDVQVYHMALDERGIRFDEEGYAPSTDFIAEAPYRYTGFESRPGSGYWEIDVETVTKGVCKALLEKAEEYDDGFYRLGPDYIMAVEYGTSGLALYKGDTDICQDESVMVFVIGDTEKLCALPDTNETSCSDGCLCPTGHTCKPDQKAPNYPVLPPEKTVCCPESDDADDIACDGECINKACSDPENMYFSRKTCQCECLSATMTYDPGSGHCIPSGGPCMYSFTQQTQSATSNCHYRITDVDNGNNLHSVTMTQVGTPCPTGYYCSLSHFDENCTSPINRGNVGASAPEDVWGVCVVRTAASTICHVTGIASGGLTEIQGCPYGQYCNLKWKGETCSTTISSGDVTGTMLGVCLPRTSKTINECPITN